MGTSYVGFDLGTTNSSAAVFDGERVQPVRSRQGGNLTPSVVRISKRGTVTVGEKARRFVESDPDNTHGAFKRLMGTSERLRFLAANVTRTPIELSAEVLRSMAADVEQQLGCAPSAGVVTVPALFELPQTAATREAAQVAGLSRVELLQEPVASALAAGWDQEGEGRWLVYDLGGGTFDCSLVEGTGDGLLRVVGHDGDNFLGGRDLDAAVLDWLLVELAARSGRALSRDNPDHQRCLRQLLHAVEEAKIDLSRADRTTIALAEPLVLGGDELDVEVELDRPTLHRLAAPVIDRSIDICRRLLTDQGSDGVQRVVLVGGPTAMELVRSRCAERLGPLAQSGDPMTLVAQGAALYAAAAGLDASVAGPTITGTVGSVNAGPGAATLWLQYASVSPDLSPHVVGRAVGAPPARVVLTRHDGKWEGAAEPDAEGAFVTSVELLPRTLTRFTIQAENEAGERCPAVPAEISIVHGISIGAPPLSRSIGVALANGNVREYFARGTPLPARRTFMHRTVTALGPDVVGELRVPIVQGEHDRAHLCREVGTIVLEGASLPRTLPAGSEVELTIELDRGGHLRAQALVPIVDRIYEGVAHLLVPDCEPDVLASCLRELQDRLAVVRRRALDEGDADDGGMANLQEAERQIWAAASAIEAARGGDADALQRAHRNLKDVDAVVTEEELRDQWRELDDEAQDALTWATGWVDAHGTPSERKLLDEVARGVDVARSRRSVGQLRRRLRRVNSLGWAARRRDPEYWFEEFDATAGRLPEMSDVPRASVLVQEGRALARARDGGGLRRVVQQLWDLLPPREEVRERAHGSGVQ